MTTSTPTVATDATAAQQCTEPARSELGQRIVRVVTAARAAGSRQAIATALASVVPDELAEFFHTNLSEAPRRPPLTVGLPASPGVATGRAVMSADDALAAADRGEDVILVRRETSPEDVLGMQASRGILTARGGLVSHAAVVARGWGIPAVVGATELQIHEDSISIGAHELAAGDIITIDGRSGSVYPGLLETSRSEPPPELDDLLTWADAVARGHVDVRVNADTEADARHGRGLGACGIGLCRTEHMFLSADRLPVMQRFILSDDPAEEAAALAALEVAQCKDFETLLEAMDGLPVTVRLLDPPLHEFLPDRIDLERRDARGELSEGDRVRLHAVRRLHETNPMLGTRGVRLGLIRRGLYEMQVRALCRAAATRFARGGRPRVEIMIPLVVDAEELRIARSWITDALDEIGHPELASNVVTVGAMIETPRAALVAGSLARHVDFFSFGTNDLTQMTYAFSRDDVEANLLPAYRGLGVLPTNPFSIIDQDGVGQLIRVASDSARATSPSIKLGVCGEHAGESSSIDFLVRLGVDSVSCSPLRVPMARLGVARALLACGRARVDDIDVADPTASADTSVDVPRSAQEHDPGDASPGATDAHAAPSTDAVDDSVVLHTLRIRGMATPPGFDQSIGTFPADALARLVSEGYVRHIATRDMYALTPAGTDRHRALLDEQSPPDEVDRLAVPYAAFLRLNDELKQLCSDWQIRDGAPNDHTDSGYDAACIERLGDLHRRTRSVLQDFAGVIPRFARYERRLSDAHDAVCSGALDRFTGVMKNSFHDIWMELHQDLIVLQRINRAAEGSF